MFITFYELKWVNKELHAIILIFTKFHRDRRRLHLNRYQSNEFTPSHFCILTAKCYANIPASFFFLVKWRQAIFSQFSQKKKRSKHFLCWTQMRCVRAGWRAIEGKKKRLGRQTACLLELWQFVYLNTRVTWNQCSERSLINVAMMTAAEGNRQIVWFGFGQEVTLFSYM